MRKAKEERPRYEKSPYCAEEVQDEAVKCRYCGEVLGKEKSILGDQILTAVRGLDYKNVKKEQYGVPALLSLIIPGLGQLVKGQTGKGIGIFCVTSLGYFVLIVPGIIIHIWNIYDAYNAPRNDP